MKDRPEHQNMSLCESVARLPTPHQIHGSKNHTLAGLRANFNLHFEARKLTVACFPLLPLILLLPLAPPPPGSRALPPVLPSTPLRPSFSLCVSTTVVWGQGRGLPSPYVRYTRPPKPPWKTNHSPDQMSPFQRQSLLVFDRGLPYT